MIIVSMRRRTAALLRMRSITSPSPSILPECGPLPPVGDPCIWVSSIFGSQSDSSIVTSQSSSDPISLETHHFGLMLILGHRQISGVLNFQQRPNIPGDPIILETHLLWSLLLLGHRHIPSHPSQILQRPNIPGDPLFWVYACFGSLVDSSSHALLFSHFHL